MWNVRYRSVLKGNFSLEESQLHTSDSGFLLFLLYLSYLCRLEWMENSSAGILELMGTLGSGAGPGGGWVQSPGLHI